MSRLPPAPKLTAEALSAVTAANRPQGEQPPAHDGDGDSDSSGHSSHSSYQERQRAEHLGEAQGGPPSVVKPVASAAAVLLLLFVGQALALWLFTRGFLLTRTTLDGVSTCEKPGSHSWSLPHLHLQAGQLESDEDFNKWEEAIVRDAECTLPPMYKRTLLWIIDALRYDFIADVSQTHPDKDANVTWQPNPFYQGVLDVPSRVHKSAQQSSFSLLAHFLADAPTTTLQRLKGLSTGSLPTFVDAGSNFGGTEITEDNWLSQLRSAALSASGNQAPTKAKMAMAGDDTWFSVFPSVFDADWSFPFDSFNVEDLDSVDRGVKEKLDTFLSGQNASFADWRLLVAHTLGVDHVGHRLGASHPRMRTKLLEMNEYLDYVVDHLPSDALLIFIGDHGMDEKGDHGGDGELEVGAALWMYGKGKRSFNSEKDFSYIVEPSIDLVDSHAKFSPLPSPPFALRGHRSIPQIDMVPTVSLLLGLPIPFNNLGSVIPEAFDSTSTLVRALRINAFQIHRYLQRYAETSSDLAAFKQDLQAAWRAALQADARLAQSPSSHERQLDVGRAYMYFNRLALTRAKSVWAQFEGVKITLGLILLALNLAVLVTIKRRASIDDVEGLLRHLVSSSNPSLAGGALFALFGKIVSQQLPLPVFVTLSLAESVGLGAIVGAYVGILFSSPAHSDGRRREGDWSLIGFLLPVAHALCFSSNSFTVHEDQVVLSLTVAVLLLRALQGYLNGPSTRYKVRMPLCAAAGAIAIRLASLSRVCREEQAPDCRTTFYAQTQSSLNSPWVIGLSYASALFLPYLLQRALRISRSDAGIAPLFFTWIVRPSLLAGCGYWLVDWLLTSDDVDTSGSSADALLEFAKLALARFDFAVVCIIGTVLWLFSPLCLEMRQEQVPSASAPSSAPAAPPASTTRIIVLGFSNSFGSSYLLLLSVVFCLHYLVAQPMGQVALSLTLVTIVALAELGDQERDAESVAVAVKRRQQPSAGAAEEGDEPVMTSLLDTSTLALLGFVTFFATGHQATFASIQWRTAFIGLRSVQYPFSPLLVALNSFGPLAIIPALSVPLLVLWNLAPKPRAAPAAKTNESDTSIPATHSRRMPTVMHVLQASLSFLLYQTVVTLSSTFFAAHFRRHLMLFKIWTPRFMLGVCTLQLTYVGLLLGLLAAGNVMSKVVVTFGSQF